MSVRRSPLEDPRRTKVEEYAQAAEGAWRLGGPEASDPLFAKAAAIEEKVARGVPESSPRTRSVLAISAVALWYKARDYARAKRTAYAFLASEEGLTPQGRSELEDLVDRCSRDAALTQELGKDPKMELVEIKLDGGMVAKGLAPASAVRDRREASLRLLMRSAELEANLPYRERGESDLEAEDQIQIYEAPALAASYGLRFYVATGAQQNIASEQKAQPDRVVALFLDLANTVGAGADAIRTKVSDPQYAQSFVRDFAEIAPDGEKVGRVVCSSPSWKVQTQPIVFEPEHRRALRAAAPQLEPLPPQPQGKPIEGKLAKFSQARGDTWIEVEEHEGKSPRLVWMSDSKLKAKVLKLTDEERDIWVRVHAKYKGGSRGPQRDVMITIVEIDPPTHT